MRYAVLLEGQELIIIDNIKHYFAQQYFEKYLEEKEKRKESLTGELVAKNTLTFKLIYNLNSGVVTLQAKEDKKNVKEYFNSQAFSDYTVPILEAIKWLSKLCMVYHIFMQGDKDINKLILKAELVNKEGKINYNVNEPHLDQLLVAIVRKVSPRDPSKVQRFFGLFDNTNKQNDEKKPIYKAIYSGLINLIKMDIDTISSLSHVDELVKAMENHKKNTAKTAQPPATPPVTLKRL